MFEKITSSDVVGIIVVLLVLTWALIKFYSN